MNADLIDDAVTRQITALLTAHTAEYLTCHDADMIATVAAATGHPRYAAALLLQHANGEDGDTSDPHAAIREAYCAPDSQLLAALRNGNDPGQAFAVAAQTQAVGYRLAEAHVATLISATSPATRAGETVTTPATITARPGDLGLA